MWYYRWALEFHGSQAHVHKNNGIKDAWNGGRGPRLPPWRISIASSLLLPVVAFKPAQNQNSEQYTNDLGHKSKESRQERSFCFVLQVHVILTHWPLVPEWRAIDIWGRNNASNIFVWLFRWSFLFCIPELLCFKYASDQWGWGRNYFVRETKLKIVCDYRMTTVSETVGHVFPFSLTHWGRDKMAAILQTTLSSAFSWMKIFQFRLKFHWSLFIWVQLTTFQHWFRYLINGLAPTRRQAIIWTNDG